MTDDKTPSAEAADLRNQLEQLRATDPAPRAAAAAQQASDTLSQTAANVRDTVTDTAARVADTVVPPLRDGVERVRGAVASARNTVAEAGRQKDALSERVRDQPFLTVGLGVLAGYIIGRAVR